jgi:predicted RNA binding protein YcfA (HicA-like mRNA interferase family)
LLAPSSGKVGNFAGSHHIYGKDGSIVRLSVPIHGNTSLKLGLLRHLMKQAGIKESDI